MPNRGVLLDTNGWLALLNRADSLHDPADAIWGKLVRQRCSVVVTDWIIAETGNGLARSASRSRLRQAVDLLRASDHARIVFITDSLLDRALQLYGARTDKTWGLVDCASFVVMEGEGIQEALTNDRHFEQAGFSCLLS